MKINTWTELIENCLRAGDHQQQSTETMNFISYKRQLKNLLKSGRSVYSFKVISCYWHTQYVLAVKMEHKDDIRKSTSYFLYGLYIICEDCYHDFSSDFSSLKKKFPDSICEHSFDECNLELKQRQTAGDIFFLFFLVFFFFSFCFHLPVCCWASCSALPVVCQSKSDFCCCWTTHNIQVQVRERKIHKRKKIPTSMCLPAATVRTSYYMLLSPLSKSPQWRL